MMNVVPWINREEFIQINDELFHTNNVQDIQHAINRIQAWKSRSSRLPVAIEATRELTSALLIYKVHQASNTVFDKEEEICRELSLAIVRFVNHITEAGQTREFARPIIVIAKEYGIPEWIVHLRHEITHSTIPAFDVLLRGVNTALQWLQERFWEVQIQTLPPKAKISSKKFDIKGILQSYIEQRLKAVEAGYGIHGTQNLSKNTISAFSHSAYKKELLCCLCDVGGLIPTDKQLQIFNIQSQDLVHTEDLSLPTILVQFWIPVLKLIKKLGYGVDLILDLIKNIDNSNILHTRFICGWISHLTFNSENCSKKKGHNMSLLPTERSCMVLGRILHQPTLYTPLLIKHFKQQLQMNIAVEKKLLDMLQIYYSTDDDVTDDLMDCGGLESSDDDNFFRDVHNIKDIVTSQPEYTGHWRLQNSDIDWTSVPLGCLPGQLLHCDDLEITEDTVSITTHSQFSYQPEQTTSSDHSSVNNTASEYTRLKQSRTEKRFTIEQENYMKNKINSFII